jgi:hypothetical protein
MTLRGLIEAVPKSWDDVNGTAHFTREDLFKAGRQRGLRDALYLVDHTVTEGKMSERRAIANAILRALEADAAREAKP